MYTDLKICPLLFGRKAYFLVCSFSDISFFCFSEKLLSLLPEYVVPYTIHLLAHDPDYVKVQDIEQLKDIKE